MLELLTHTTLSDGSQTPAEALRSAKIQGYQALVLSDHCDPSNLLEVIEANKRLKEVALHIGIDLIVGVELTHIPPPLIEQYVLTARKLGAEFVAVHGEKINLNTKTNPFNPQSSLMERGTNLAAILGGADLLAHPGLISEEEVKLASELGVFLDLSAFSKNGLSNGHIAKLALKYNAKLVVCANPHADLDFLTQEEYKIVAKAAGLNNDDVTKMLHDINMLLCKLYKR
ncbi:histidinol phosphate phosphatase domain-containing protein [Desulfovibrio litoralis]|uniref:Histidinol phosphatase n=1 Tax=Desulfovibrio litoralis DSM 11393 TaxID=1121455 RepID=A0A1M7SB15_9BACT|nr:histidinol phosphate phosphatase domain-containing protein [Desulfovibrio litoralis]SHN55719.1 Histidinol phosphatase [Desulfovibrio litoralis DSM 11393]